MLIALLAMSRFVHRWNQTGQKHVGEPDVAKSFLMAHKTVLWTLILATYFAIAQRMTWDDNPQTSRQASRLAAVLSCFAAFVFKAATANADAPAILIDLRQSDLQLIRGPSLVFLARIVYLAIGLLAIVTTMKGLQRRAAINELGTSSDPNF